MRKKERKKERKIRRKMEKRSKKKKVSDYDVSLMDKEKLYN